MSETRADIILGFRDEGSAAMRRTMSQMESEAKKLAAALKSGDAATADSARAALRAAQQDYRAGSERMGLRAQLAAQDAGWSPSGASAGGWRGGGWMGGRGAMRGEAASSLIRLVGGEALGALAPAIGPAVQMFMGLGVAGGAAVGAIALLKAQVDSASESLRNMEVSARANNDFNIASNARRNQPTPTTDLGELLRKDLAGLKELQTADEKRMADLKEGHWWAHGPAGDTTGWGSGMTPTERTEYEQLKAATKGRGEDVVSGQKRLMEEDEVARLRRRVAMNAKSFDDWNRREFGKVGGDAGSVSAWQADKKRSDDALMAGIEAEDRRRREAEAKAAAAEMKRIGGDRGGLAAWDAQREADRTREDLIFREAMAEVKRRRKRETVLGAGSIEAVESRTGAAGVRNDSPAWVDGLTRRQDLTVETLREIRNLTRQLLQQGVVISPVGDV